MLHIKVPTSFLTNALITIADLSGKMMGQYNLEVADLSLDLRSYPSGIYLLKYQDDRVSSVSRIVKQ